MLLRATEVGRNKPAQAGVSGELTGQMPETVASRPYSGLRQILNSTVLGIPAFLPRPIQATVAAFKDCRGLTPFKGPPVDHT